MGTTALMLGAGIAVGASALLIARRDRASHEHGGASHEHDGVPISPSRTPVGPGNLAVAWWPQDMSLEQRGGDATLRFQSTVVNLGGEALDVRPGDRVEYAVLRSDSKGRLGEVVARGSAPLGSADVEPFPVHVGVDVGRPISDLGRELADITSLAPQHAAIVGAGHASQALVIADARAGHYTLRQQVVRADGSADPSRFDDVRLTEFTLDGTGSILHLGSRYAG